MPRMIASIFALALLPTLLGRAIGGEYGSLCVAPARAAAEPGDKWGWDKTNSYTVLIDDRAQVDLRDKQGTRVIGLNVEQRHIVKIRKNANQVAAFRFRFADFRSRDLCLWFKPLYETWSLSPAGDRRGICSCK